MKILVIGLDSATPEYLFGDEQLVNIRRLMELGVYGHLQGVLPPTPILAWLCMSTSQDPGVLGIYSSDNWPHNLDLTQEHRYAGPFISQSIWDQIAHEGRRSIVVDVPPFGSKSEVDSTSLVRFMTTHAAPSIPAEQPSFISEEMTSLVDSTDDQGGEIHTHNEERLLDQIYATTRTRFEVIRHLIEHEEWDYFQFIETGLASVLKLFLRYNDPLHPLYEPNSPYASAIRDYCRYLDEAIGSLFEYLDGETGVLIVSACGAELSNNGDTGAFILAAPESPLNGELTGVNLLDIAPTLLDLASYDVPSSMQGQSLLTTLPAVASTGTSLSDEEAIIRERLRGLGYI
jgi:predicted AlkP superfamily phosphohydrolase/phosphomutase